MRRGKKIAAGFSPLKSVLLLLAIAVVLPTVCLLWFMTQAVKNERLAVRQKLLSVYTEKLADASRKNDAMWSKNCKDLDEQKTDEHPYQRFIELVDESGYDGLIVYDAAGKLAHPLFSDKLDIVTKPFKEFGDAWRLEFTEQKFAQAAKFYEQKIQAYDNHIRLAAIIGRSRCLAKLGEVDHAIQQCKKAAFSPQQAQGDSATLLLIGNARLMLINFLKQNPKYTKLLEQTCDKIIEMVYSTNEAGQALTANQNLFFTQKILEIISENPSLEGYAKTKTHRLQKLALAEERSINIAERFPKMTDLNKRQVNQWYRLQADEDIIYGLYHKTENETLLLLLSRESIGSLLSDYENASENSGTAYRILDGSGRFVVGLDQPQGKPFVEAAVGKNFEGWKIELYFEDGEIFEKAADKQITVYLWTGVLVAVVILIAGGFAGQAVGKQIKLNKMKNDFIATVSHELKTPLSSMRVMVDTLLEGNYKDQQQAEQYLQLTSKENQRLSRLIDNFLTFSRMERCKQAFQISETSPAKIAQEAVDIVKARFDQTLCEFEVNIHQNLPNILADPDAIVTVLINLLDNAYKYSKDEKRIVFWVFFKDNMVHFQITDNGLGLSRWAIKKIFKRFYQVDRSLSRQTEGCGLGLAIVKFIVDAHKGSIIVKSKPGKGSAFTVKLPAIT